jgi:hypothetical protein
LTAAGASASLTSCEPALEPSSRSRSSRPSRPGRGQASDLDDAVLDTLEGCFGGGLPGVPEPAIATFARPIAHRIATTVQPADRNEASVSVSLSLPSPGGDGGGPPWGTIALVVCGIAGVVGVGAAVMRS